MTFRTRDLVTAGICLLIAGLCAFALAGCGPLEKAYPTPEAPPCFTETNLESADVACAPLKSHEHTAGMSFLLWTRTDLSANSKNMLGWRVVIRSEGWSEKYGRAYFTDPSAPGWLLWGLTDFATQTIYLADDNLARAVLAHEECHVHFPPPYTHDDWPRLGCDRVEKDVAEALALASGVYDGNAADGVFDPEGR